MVRSKFLFSTNLSRMTRIILLAFSWIAGMFFGLNESVPDTAVTVSLMHTVVRSSVSIVGLIAVLVFPLIISALAVFLSAPLVFLPLAFFKAFGYTVCSILIVSAFGSAGWLIRGLLLFSDTCMSIALLWFWFRNIEGKRLSSKKDLAVCAIFALLVGCIDYFVVSPFLGMLYQ